MVKHPHTDKHRSAFDPRPESKPTPRPEDEKLFEVSSEEEMDLAMTTAA